MKRDTTQTIWRTVVFAGAMLGAPACGNKNAPAPVTPANTANATPKPAMGSAVSTPADPNATTGDPCGGTTESTPARPRGADDDGGGGMGRGFVLS